MNKRPPCAKMAASESPSGPVDEALVVVCFGEIIWDCLPRGIFLGGAPLNVAYHLSRLGISPRLISAVGRDFLGEEALRRLTAWGLESGFVTRCDRATGTVRATLDGGGAARYVFDSCPAWDRISVSRLRRSRQLAPQALVFGTLALRERANRQSLQKLLDAWPAALRVVDINLRAPFDRSEVATWALRRATLLKLNVEELTRLVRLVRETPVGYAKAVRSLARKYRLDRICLTAGAHGAGVLWDGDWHWSEARPVKVRDTVGAGDAFLAALLAGLLVWRESPAEALVRACRQGEFVATQDGATPAYRVDGRGIASILSRGL